MAEKEILRGERLREDPDFPTRPQHDDFWMMSDIVIKLDRDIHTQHKGIPEVFDDDLDIDVYSAEYMAVQRGMRAIDVTEAPMTLSTLSWLDGFTVGVLFARKKDGGE